ncbi:unnamed protein product [Prunus brigantina]
MFPSLQVILWWGYSIQVVIEPLLLLSNILPSLLKRLGIQ